MKNAHSSNPISALTTFRRAPLASVFLAMALVTASVPAGAQLDCSELCTWSSDCSTDCVDGELFTTCGGYGVCDPGPPPGFPE